MTRYERKRFFERLMTLRDAYRAEAQVVTELTIEHVFAFAEQAYNTAAAEEAAITSTQGDQAAD